MPVPLAALLMPLGGVITQGVHPGHQALDIACLPGTPVHAAHKGIGRTHWSSDLGWTFVLRREDGLETSYSHLRQGAPSGAYEAGEVVGLCGNTGRLSTGPHLHFASNRPDRLKNLVTPTTAILAAALEKADWLVARKFAKGI